MQYSDGFQAYNFGGECRDEQYSIGGILCVLYYLLCQIPAGALLLSVVHSFDVIIGLHVDKHFNIGEGWADAAEQKEESDVFLFVIGEVVVC